MKKLTGVFRSFAKAPKIGLELTESNKTAHSFMNVLLEILIFSLSEFRVFEII
jgi:hypothetical protein